MKRPYSEESPAERCRGRRMEAKEESTGGAMRSISQKIHGGNHEVDEERLTVLINVTVISCELRSKVDAVNNSLSDRQAVSP